MDSEARQTQVKKSITALIKKPVCRSFLFMETTKKPSAAQIADLDVVIFDLQDVGTRFFTYISTMHYVMEACAEQGKKVIIFDRPNPNGATSMARCSSLVSNPL